MKISTMALFLGGALVCGVGGIGLAACSSDSNTGNPTGGDSGGNHDGTTGSEGGGGDGGAIDSGGNEGGGDSAGGCTHGNPPSLHVSDGGPTSLFCGFKANDAGTLYCDPHTQNCCVGGSMGTGFADPTCNTKGVACVNGTMPKEIDCEDSNDCPVVGSICCYTGPVPTLDPTCNYYRATSGISTHCVDPDAGTACASGEQQICSSNAECPSGKTCTPFKTIYFGLGFCM
jgi:hypothetical protein